MKKILFSKEEEAEMWHLHKDKGWTLKEVGAKLECNYSTIRKILKMNYPEEYQKVAKEHHAKQCRKMGLENGPVNGVKNLEKWREEHSEELAEYCRKIGQAPKTAKQLEASAEQWRKMGLISQTGEKAPNWKGGISFEPYCQKFNEDLKERIRNFFDRKCYICGKTEFENGRKFDVHHINYDKMVCCNTVKPLFVPLCRSCHAKTNANREFWEEFFTISLEYLTHGKCF